MGCNAVSFAMVVMIPMVVNAVIGGQRLIGKRNVPPSGLGNFDYPDYSTKYEDYPVIVPKRAALLFDQLMVALQKVVDNQGREGDIGDNGRTSTRSLNISPAANSQLVPSTDEQTMDLQRRGQAKGRVYWRCYFNAVTCFRKK